METAHGEKAALLVERKLDARDQIASLVVAEKGLAALAYPLDRPPDPLRRPQHQREFREDRVLGSEIPADVVRDHANLLGLHAEHGGKLALLADDAAAAGVNEVTILLLVIAADRGARLHRHAGDA